MLAVVTGATRGIGRAIAVRFAMAGFDLAVTSRSATELTLMKNELEKEFKVKVFAKPANFQKKADVVLFAEFAKQAGARVDVLVNNVGQYLYGNIFDEPGDKLAEQLQVNLLSAHYLTSALAENFKKHRSGHIFTIGSILSKNLRDDAAFYTISKHALYTWHQLLMNEMRQYNVRATFVAPSSTFTSSWEGSNVKGEELIQPENIAEAIYDCYNMTGSALVDEISIKTMLKKYD